MTKSNNKKLYCPGCQGTPVIPTETQNGVICMAHPDAGPLVTKEKHMARLKKTDVERYSSGIIKDPVLRDKKLWR